MGHTMYIYALRDRDTGQIGYVGGSQNPNRRLGQHLSENPQKNPEKTKWLSSLQDIPEVVILEEVPFKKNGPYWTEKESYWIWHLHDAGHPLTNAVIKSQGDDRHPPLPFQCVECGSFETPHQANGLCRNCYMRQYRRKQSENTSSVSLYNTTHIRNAHEQGYARGLQEGYERAVADSLQDNPIIASINLAIQRFPDSECYIRNSRVYLRIQGQTLSAPITINGD